MAVRREEYTGDSFITGNVLGQPVEEQNPALVPLLGQEAPLADVVALQEQMAASQEEIEAYSAQIAAYDAAIAECEAKIAECEENIKAILSAGLGAVMAGFMPCFYPSQFIYCFSVLSACFGVSLCTVMYITIALLPLAGAVLGYASYKGGSAVMQWLAHTKPSPESGLAPDI